MHLVALKHQLLPLLAGASLVSLALSPVPVLAQSTNLNFQSLSITGLIKGVPGRGLFLAATDGCQPAATQKKDVIDCTGSVSSSINGLGGNDTVTVVGGASMTVERSSSGFSNTTGVDGGLGNDTLVNNGAVDVSSGGLTTISTGISGGRGDDTIRNLSTLSATGTAVQTRTDVDIIVGGSAQTEASATATGIGGGDGKDKITNAGTLTATASAQANTNNIRINADFGKLDASTSAGATAVGLDGGNATDTITNTSSLTVGATADAKSLDVQLNAVDIFAGTVTVTADAKSTGIAAGGGTGTITNTGAITVSSQATAQSISPQFSFFDRAEADATTSAIATSTGIQGGTGESLITNGDETTGAGKLTVTATAESTAVSAVIGIKAPARLVAPGPESKFNAVTDATATGIIAGDKKDTIKNFAETNVTATGTSLSLSGTFEKDGAADVQAVAKSTATATGIDGGAGDNEITNKSALTVTADATSHSLNIGWNHTGDLIPIPSAVELVKGKPPETDAERIADARATGITSGNGSDQVTNSGSITADATALALSEAASVSVEVESKEEPKKGGKEPGKIKKFLEKAKSIAGKIHDVLDLDPLKDAAIDTSVHAEADSTGIVAGSGGNIVTNDGSIKGTADAQAFASSALLDFTLTKEEDPKGKAFLFKPGLAKSQSTANASANGVETGSDNDSITNNGEIVFTAKATANSLGVTAINQPKLAGVGLTAAMSDTSTITGAAASGISSGAGDDVIVNNGTIAAASESKAFAESVGVNVEATGKGLEMGAALTNSNTTATATAVGIDAGTGQDQVFNKNTLSANANARANSLSASVAVQGAVDGVGLQGALSDSATAATTVATGIKTGGDLADTLVNAGTFDEEGKLVKPGAIHVSADAGAFAESVSVSVQLGGNGLEANGALTKSDTTADAHAVGIDSMGTGSVVGNLGEITVDAIAKSNSLGISVGVQSGVDGLGISGALSDTATKSDAVGVGIKNSGQGDEQISNSGTVTARSDSRAFAESVGVNIQMGGGGVSAGAALTLSGARADATATGIDAGSKAKSLSNSGDVTGDATAVGNSLGVSFGFQGSATGVGLSGALSDAKTESYATGIGVTSQGPIGTEIVNTGNITGKADAQAYSEAASINIQAGGTGLEVSAALARSGTLADATARGIDLAGGNQVANEGTIRADADAATNSFSLSLAGQGSVTGIGLQGALTDSATMATARATAANLTSGSNMYTQFTEGATVAEADSLAAAQSVSATFSGFSSVGATIGAALARTGVQSEADAIGVAGGSSIDTVVNSGNVTATSNAGATALGISAGLGFTQTGFGAQGAAVDASTHSQALATGITTGAGPDVIQNDDLIDAAATATTQATTVGVSIAGTTTGVSLGAALARSTNEAHAESTAVHAGDDNDQIVNNTTGTVTSTATAESDAVGVTVGLGVVQSGAAFAGSATDTSTKGNANAVGLHGGAGDDTLKNFGSITATATSTAGSTTVSVTGSVAVTGLSAGATLARATTEAESFSNGMKGGDGNDSVTNKGSIVSNATATADTFGALVGIGFASSGIALSGTGADTSLKSIASSHGMSGGAGADTLRNESTVQTTATANVDADTFSVNISGTASGASVSAALARSKSEGKATSTGIGGDNDNDTIFNIGTVTSNATSTVSTLDVSAALGVTGTGVAVGATAVDTSATSLANAAGLSGGSGADVIYSEGTVDAVTDAQITTKGFSVSASGAVTGVGAGIALSRAVTAAVANSTAISGDKFVIAIGDDAQIVEADEAGAENDTIESRHALSATATANSTAHSTSVSLGLTGTGVQAGGALADLQTNAIARATGISGGAGNDALNSYDAITATSDAAASGASVSVALQGNLAGVAVGVALTNATMLADATSTGISGGDGNDSFFNAGAIGAGAKAQATATSVAVSAPIAVVPLGAALADSSATANARAYGIIGGDGNDVINNQGTITIGTIGAEEGGADARAIGRSVAGSVVGASIGDANAIATSTAMGISGGAGEDIIGNDKTVTATGRSVSTGTTVTIALAGVSMGDARAEANASAGAIGGGTENDIIINLGNLATEAVAEARSTSVNITLLGAALGNLLRDSRTTATSAASGIEGNEGADVIFNSGRLQATSQATAKDVAVNIALGPGGGAAVGKVGSEAHATSTGIDGGSGDDSIQSHGSLDLSAVASAPSTSIDLNIQLGGAAVGNADTLAEAMTTGVSGGQGNDTVTASSTLTGFSDAKTGTGGVAVNLIGAASINANITATAMGIGIDGGDDDDTLTNFATIDWTAMSDARASSVSVNLVGAALGGATTLSSATVIGIGGGNGNDVIANQGEITVTADAKTQAGGVTVTLAGNAEANSNIQAIANATGIGGGGGKDTITNSGAIKSTAIADAPATSVNVNIAGTALGDARTTAEATSVGIRGGEGDDTILNFSTIEAISNATTSAHNVSIVIAGLASSSRDVLTATTSASGILGNEGNDLIESKGDVTVAATSTTTISGSTVNIFGTSQSGGTANTNVNSVGVDGSEGDDVIHNFAKVNVGATGTMTIDSGNFEFAGVASAAGSLISNGSATGIAGGTGIDSINNHGEVQVTSSANLTATGNTKAIFGSANTDAALNANASAVGINGGEGADSIINSNLVKATSSATMTSSKPTLTFAGGLSADALLEATSKTLGIDGGDGDDSIYNSGTIDVTAISTQTATGGSKAVIAGGGTASATSTATANATGVDAGTGNNFITNDGVLNVQANPSGNVTNTSDAGFLFGTSGARSDLNFLSTSQGIRFDSGNNTVINNGAIKVDADSRGTATATAVGATLANGDAAGTAIAKADGAAFDLNSGGFAYGIKGYGGNNVITNNSSITVSAKPQITATASVNGNGIDGDGTGTATATVKAEAAGIDLGDGANQIFNNGVLNVTATPKATANASVDSDVGGTARATATASATAQAIGVRAGGGGNLIVNAGQIVVAAEPTAAANAKASADSISVCIPFTRICTEITVGTAISKAQSPESGTAIGIDTGSGNDTIVNNGTITVTKTVEDVTSNGVAIRSGAGDDTVVLGNGSVTTGSVELGDGNDTLRLVGTPTVNGNIDSGSGTNSLVFYGNGSFSSSLSGFVNALKQGAGTFTLPSLPTMTGKLEVKEGTLQVNSNYQMAASSTFQTTVNSDGSYGQLKVGGTAGLDGALVVDKGLGTYVNGTTYEIVSANSVTGGFDSQQLPAPTALVSFSTNQTSTAFQVQANVAALATVARNGVGASLAKYLDQAAPTANSDLARVLGDFQQLSQHDFNRGFSSLSQESYHPFSAATFTTLDRYNGAIHTRMNIARASFRGMPLVEAIDRTDLAQEAYLAQFGSTPLTLDLFDRSNFQEARRQPGFWLSGFGNTMAQNEGGGFSGFNYRTQGIPVGFDFRLSDQLIAGVAATQSHGVLTFQNQQSKGSSEGAFATIYGTYFTANAELEGMFSYGRDSFTNARQIALGGIDRHASSEHQSDVFAARLEGRYHFNIDGFRIEPFASMQYSRLNVDGFRERGAGDLDLFVDQRSVDALVSQVGFRFLSPVALRVGTLIPELTAAWQHDFHLGNNSIAASLRGAPQEQFRIGAPNDSGSALKLGGALTFIGNQNFSGAAGVNAVVGKSNPGVSGLLQLQFKW